MTYADPGRDAGTINGHAGAHADVELPDGHTDAGSADGNTHSANRHTDVGSTNRYASISYGHGSARADMDSANGYADAAAAAYGHANLPADCGRYRNGRSSGLDSCNRWEHEQGADSWVGADCRHRDVVALCGGFFALAKGSTRIRVYITKKEV